jgi:hypothetical protein
VVAGVAAGAVVAYGVGDYVHNFIADMPQQWTSPWRRRMGLFNRTADKLNGRTVLLFAADPGDALTQAVRRYDPGVRSWPEVRVVCEPGCRWSWRAWRVPGARAITSDRVGANSAPISLVERSCAVASNNLSG